MIVRSRNLLFVHIPKNGGTAVTAAFSRALTALGHKLRNGSRFEQTAFKGRLPIHSSLQHYVDSGAVPREDIDKWLKFAVVRDPIERAKSFYCYLSPSKTGDRYVNLMSFDQFVAEVIPAKFEDVKTEQGRFFLRPQSEYVTLDGKPALDAMLPIEALHRVGRLIRAVLGVEQSIQKENVSLKPPEIVVTPETRQRVLDLYPNDLALHQTALEFYHAES